MNDRVFIGVPCYGSAPAPTVEDFMRMSYYFGRRYPEFDFLLGIIDKTEQFRARNRIVEGAVSSGAKYLLMLDDDMVVDIEGASRPSERYEFLRKMIAHMEADEKLGICGALYFQRGGEYHPVAMFSEPEKGRYYWMRDEQIRHELQPVDVAGGGILLIRMEVFNRIPSPWFEPEMQVDGPSRGTDVQICEKVRAAGWTVKIDSSIELGHVSSRREVVTSANRHKARSAGNELTERVQADWYLNTMLAVFSSDVEEYLGMKREEINALGEQYNELNLWRFPQYENLGDYYRSIGKDQLCRQYYFHNLPGYGAKQFLKPLMKGFGDRKLSGLDFGCGAAPLGFELALQGHRMDFVDIDETSAYEFVKWRAKKRGVKCGFSLSEDYDFILLTDVIEHLPNWKDVLTNLASRLKHGGLIVTNYFYLDDYTNPEHVSMDKEAVRAHLLSLDLYPQAPEAWIKGKVIPDVG